MGIGVGGGGHELLMQQEGFRLDPKRHFQAQWLCQGQPLSEAVLSHPEKLLSCLSAPLALAPVPPHSAGCITPWEGFLIRAQTTA